jgi:hypothetical protein
MFLVSVIWTLPRRLSSDHPLRLGNIHANSTVIHSSCEKHQPTFSRDWTRRGEEFRRDQSRDVRQHALRLLLSQPPGHPLAAFSMR